MMSAEYVKMTCGTSAALLFIFISIQGSMYIDSNVSN